MSDCKNCKTVCIFREEFNLYKHNCKNNCDKECDCLIPCYFCESVDSVRYFDFIHGTATFHNHIQGGVVQRSGDLPICEECQSKCCWDDCGICTKPCTVCGSPCDDGCGCVCELCNKTTEIGGCECYKSRLDRFGF